ncbi:hypothetical protein F4782DRAFT_519052 [Xylaria castorea]|nr:hypothetical protein F4782DRAFT_519052 [Xylaria castorea]
MISLDSHIDDDHGEESHSMDIPLTPATTRNNDISNISPRQSSGPSYESLMNYKRSSDPNSIARRSSLSEQKPQSGFFGSMWHNFTRGPQDQNK